MRKTHGRHEPGSPLQERSRGTLARLVEAARALVAERGVDELKVADVAARAGTSVGNFYRRFAGKDALLDHLEREFLAGRRAAWEAILDPARWEGAPARDVVERVVREIVARHREHRDFLRAIARRERDAYEARAAPGHEATARSLAALLAPRLEIRHPDPERAVAFALELAAATAGERVLFRAPPATARDDERLVAELTRAVLAYLHAPAAA